MTPWLEHLDNAQARRQWQPTSGPATSVVLLASSLATRWTSSRCASRRARHQPQRHFGARPAWSTGTAAPILGYGALNALLFMSYNRSEAALNRALSVQHNLWTTWVAGALGGLATWVVSTPTELIKCRAQMAVPAVPSWQIARSIVASDGRSRAVFGRALSQLCAIALDTVSISGRMSSPTASGQQLPAAITHRCAMRRQRFFCAAGLQA